MGRDETGFHVSKAGEQWELGSADNGEQGQDRLYNNRTGREKQYCPVKMTCLAEKGVAEEIWRMGRQRGLCWKTRRQLWAASRIMRHERNFTCLLASVSLNR